MSGARIVFDLDGTLIDSAPDIRAVANSLLSEHGRAPISLAETHAFVGSGAAVFVARMRAARDIPDSAQNELLAQFLAAYDTAVTLTRPWPGVPQALTALTGRGHRLGICTNKPIAPCRAVLDHLGLAAHFASVIGGDSLPRRKPDPVPLRAVLDALGQGPALFVGDSIVDAETARAARVPFILYTEGYRDRPVAEMPHDLALSDFADLPDLLDQYLATAG